MDNIFIFPSLNGVVLQSGSILYNHAGTGLVLELYTACESHLADLPFVSEKFPKANLHPWLKGKMRADGYCIV
jgi:hypothetical protein